MNQAFLRRGIGALLRRDLPRAYQSFAALYRSPDWALRDVALAGLGDSIDQELYTLQKAPACLQVLGWKQAQLPNPSTPLLPDGRLAILLESCLDRHRSIAQTIPEQRALGAMRRALQLLQEALLHDSHHLVRFSAYIVLHQNLGPAQQHYLLPTFEQARQMEPHPALRAALDQALHA